MPYLSRISGQLFLDDADQLLLAVQNGPQICDLLLNVLQFFLHRRDLQIRQTIQLQGKDRIRLPLGESKLARRDCSAHPAGSSTL